MILDHPPLPKPWPGQLAERHPPLALLPVPAKPAKQSPTLFLLRSEHSLPVMRKDVPQGGPLAGPELDRLPLARPGHKMSRKHLNSKGSFPNVIVAKL